MSYEEEKQDRKIEQLEAEIERLRGENAGLSKAVIDIQEERDLAQAEFRAYHKAWEEGAAWIKELEQYNAWLKADREFAYDELTAKMTELNADHQYQPEAPRSWQITDERKAALSRAYDVISWIDRVDSDNQKHIDVLRAMLKEATR